jgi:hypothetical protein
MITVYLVYEERREKGVYIHAVVTSIHKTMASAVAKKARLDDLYGDENTTFRVESWIVQP